MTPEPGLPDLGWLGERLLRLVETTTSNPVSVRAAVAVAAGVGAAHAMSPGHGKSLMAAYLVGTEGRRIDAVLLGLVVAVMHTASVLVLGAVVWFSQRLPVWAHLETVLSVLSAAAVLVVGLVLLRSAVRRLRSVSGTRSTAGAHVHHPPHRHSEERHQRDGHDHHPHDPLAPGRRADWAGSAHGHDHDHGHGHELRVGVSPLSRAGLVALATTGGLLPSPSAFLVLASSMAAGRTSLGLLLVAAFGVGLAAALTTVGLLVVQGRHELVRRVPSTARLARVVRLAPAVGAAALVLGALVLLVSGLVR